MQKQIYAAFISKKQAISFPKHFLNFFGHVVAEKPLFKNVVFWSFFTL